VWRISISSGKGVGAWGAHVVRQLGMWVCNLRVNTLDCGPRSWLGSTSRLKGRMRMSRGRTEGRLIGTHWSYKRGARRPSLASESRAKGEWRSSEEQGWTASRRGRPDALEMTDKSTNWMYNKLQQPAVLNHLRVISRLHPPLALPCLGPALGGTALALVFITAL